MDDTPWLDEAEQALWRAWLRAGTEIHAALAAELAVGSDLSMADYAVLVVLTEADGGAVRSCELADRLEWERSRLSHHVARMEKRGLIARRGCAEDRRGAWVEVTPSGREAIEAAAPDHTRSVRRHFLDPLDERDRADLARILGRLGAKYPGI